MRRSLLLVAILTAATGCTNDANDAFDGGDDGSDAAVDATDVSVTTIDRNDPPPLESEQCAVLRQLLETGPPAAIVPGAIDEEDRQRLAAELDSTIAEAPVEARPAMGVFADAYKQVLRELGSLDGSLSNPETLNPDQFATVEEIMRDPEVLRALAELEALTENC